MSDQRLIMPKRAEVTVYQNRNTARQEVVFLTGNAGETSDGYHTFDELYDHRMALTLALLKALPEEQSWRSKEHHSRNDKMFDGFFIVGLDLPTGTVTYHYKLEHWDKFRNAREVEHAPAWDGHTPKEALNRLMEYGGSK